MFEDIKLQLRFVNFFGIIVIIIMILSIILPEKKIKKVEVNCCCESECIKYGKFFR